LNTRLYLSEPGPVKVIEQENNNSKKTLLGKYKKKRSIIENKLQFDSEKPEKTEKSEKKINNINNKINVKDNEKEKDDNIPFEKTLDKYNEIEIEIEIDNCNEKNKNDNSLNHGLSNSDYYFKEKKDNINSNSYSKSLAKPEANIGLFVNYYKGEIKKNVIKYKYK
jgi:hypothetical protein